MGIELDLNFRVRRCSYSQVEGHAMADEGYIRTLTTAIQDRIEESKEQTKRDNHEADIIKSEAPRVWMELKAWLKEAIAQVNRGLTVKALMCDEETQNEIVIYSTAGEYRTDVNVTFRGLVGQITAGRVSFTAIVKGNHLQYILDKEPYTKVDVEAMGKSILDAAVKK
jgi:hypothetical protein